MLSAESVWTPVNAEAFRQHFVANLDAGSDDFMTKLRGQIGTQAPGVIRMGAEALWAVYLFPSSPPGPELRRQRLREIWSWSGEQLADSELISDRTFSGVAKGGRAFTSQLYQQLGFIGRVAAALKEQSEERRAELTRDGDPFAFAEWLDDISGPSRPSMRHMLLYYCFPDSFERMLSAGHKRLIVKTLSKVPDRRADGSEDAAAIDRELLAIRRRKAEEFGTEELDFYREPLRALWKEEAEVEGGDTDEPAETDGKTMPIRRLVVRRPDVTVDELATELAHLDLKRSTISTIRADARATIKAAKEEGRWLDAGRGEQPAANGAGASASSVTPSVNPMDRLSELFIERVQAEDILRALRERGNVILSGAPGVGKTFAARRLALALGAPQDAVVEVQFHQAYGYEDFVEGFRPTAAGGFELRAGCLRQLAERARTRSGVPHVLIVDEINRGNVSRILGEALVLLEVDKRGEVHSLSLAQSGERFWLPSNLHLLGLMNTADRSLAMVDYAIRRRFAFFTLEPAFGRPAFGEALRTAGVSESMTARIQSSMTALNRRISEDVATLGPGYCIGHSYFLGAGPSGGEEKWLRDIVATQIGPILQEYWADDPARALQETEALLAGS
jgi:hypothetical protein